MGSSLTRLSKSNHEASTSGAADMLAMLDDADVSSGLMAYMEELAIADLNHGPERDYYEARRDRREARATFRESASRLLSRMPKSKRPSLKALKRQLVQVTEFTEADENVASCAICHEEHQEKQLVATLPCGHVYHEPCADAWLSRHCSCPNCRYELKLDE